MDRKRFGPRWPFVTVTLNQTILEYMHSCREDSRETEQ